MDKVTEMRRNEKILDVIRGTFNVLFLIAIILAVVITVKACSDMVPPPQVASPSVYTATYGSFLSGYTVYHFDTYVSEGNHYTFYDAYGNIIGDVFVTGNNVFSLTGGTQ